MNKEFEWDERKAAANLAKHQISFETAAKALEDVFAIVGIDSRTGYGESRFILTGMADGLLITVVYTMRGERFRIIPARKANRYERGDYYRSQTAE